MGWIENPRTGERVRFVSESDEALVMETGEDPAALLAEHPAELRL